MTDDAPPPVHVALARVAAAVGAVPKSDRNAAQDFNYRGVESIMRAVGPALHEHGVIFLPEVLGRVVEPQPVGDRGRVWRLVTLTVRYRIVGPAGDELAVTVVGEGFDGGDKATNKALTGAFKYALLQSLGIGDGQEDSDADEAPPGRSERPSSSRDGQSPSRADAAGRAAPSARERLTRELEDRPPEVQAAVKEWRRAHDCPPLSDSRMTLEQFAGLREYVDTLAEPQPVAVADHRPPSELPGYAAGVARARAELEGRGSSS